MLKRENAVLPKLVLDKSSEKNGASVSDPFEL